MVVDKIRALTVFRRVVEIGSFTGAADDLNLSKAAISKNINELEEYLKSPLINRTTRKLHVTESGQLYYNQVCNILDNLENADLSVIESSNTLKGTLKISIPMSVGLLEINPIICEFMHDHPEVEVIATLSNEQENLLEGGFDLAIRLGHLKDSSLKARRLSARHFVICCSPDYLNTFGEPHTVTELNSHQCLIGNSSYWRVCEQGRDKHIKIAGRLQCNSGWALADAAKKGLGIVQLPNYYIEKDLEAGSLVPILTHYQPKPEGVWGVYPPRQFVATNVKALLDHLVNALN